jgi:biotin carboxylase
MLNKAPLLLIAEPHSYRIAAYLAAATRMGLNVLIASQGKNSLISEVHDGLHVDFSDKAAALRLILTQARITPFFGVLGIDDSTVELAANVAKALGFPHNAPAAARLTRRKDLARAHLLDHGCAVPAHWLIDLEQLLAAQMSEITFPCVLKPVALSASRGVIRANDVDAFISACSRIAHIVANEHEPFERQHVLVEAYIDGREIAYEGYVYNGELNTLVIFDKPEPLIGPYFEETIYVTPSDLSAAQQTRVKQRVARACEAYGLCTGPVHAELRIDDKDAWILEVAARTIGGDCARSLDNGQDFNLEELVISLAIGKKYGVAPPKEARGVMMIPIRERGILRRVEGVHKASKTKYVEKVEIYTRPGNELIPLPDGNQYPGFIFARAERADQVVAALKKAYEQIDFVVAPIISTRLGS